MATGKDIDRLLQQFLEEGIPGCALQIAQKGKTIYEGYTGYADVEKKTPVTKDSLFRLASMSKIPLYTTMMMLYERGRFLLTDPVSDYLPEWKESRKFVRKPNGELQTVPTEGPILISDVLSMKCGLPYCNTRALSDDQTVRSMQACMEPLWEKGHFTVQEHIAAMSKAVLAFEPGTHWIYGFSSEITAALIEVLADMPVDDAFQKFLFDPLGMDNTRSRYFGNAQERMVKLYAWDEERNLLPTALPFDDKHLPGQEHETGWARLFSTVNDYTKLMQMLANGGVYDGKRLMGRKTIDMMRTNGLNEIQLAELRRGDPFSAGYGYGYGVRTLIDRQQGDHNGSLGAFGWTGGFGTWCEADPAEGFSVVYMHNIMHKQLGEERFQHLRVRNVAYGCIE
ncbi:MAG: beta-lactamase family protein [Oscillospiraceae bacterium]|nr:beta-lactamase family protein [Oscillospiraceae bacterium]